MVLELEQDQHGTQERSGRADVVVLLVWGEQQQRGVRERKNKKWERLN